MFACPSRSCTTFGCTPACRASVAPAMTQVVRPDLRQPEAAHGVGESAGESFRVQHRPVDVAKQKVAVCPAGAHQ
jgi:hypothetical protein